MCQKLRNLHNLHLTYRARPYQFRILSTTILSNFAKYSFLSAIDVQYHPAHTFLHCYQLYCRCTIPQTHCFIVVVKSFICMPVNYTKKCIQLTLSNIMHWHIINPCNARQIYNEPELSSSPCCVADRNIDL